MSKHGKKHGGAEGREDVLRASRIELYDDHGRTRVSLGRLGEADGALYGVEVEAGDPSVRACMTADDRSAVLAVLHGGETVVECRVSAVDGEAPAAVEVGFGGAPLLTVEVASDGALVAALPSEVALRRHVRVVPLS